eukprot:TRINITY_DN2337_c0_g1_i7.p2 TRINITY_DN2337_c0_g1~~TRINITY_DN2337_c0_g1_i7.p2  ORF type:complete len:129 (-),score=20.13 TRINITY_DN2337_c0_g1_i7:401-787(-)
MNDKIENIQKNLLNLMNLRAKYKCTLMIQVQEWKITCEKLLTKVPQELIVNLKISNRMISIGANSDQKELANYFEDDVSNETVAGSDSALTFLHQNCANTFPDINPPSIVVKYIMETINEKILLQAYI